MKKKAYLGYRTQDEQHAFAKYFTAPAGAVPEAVQAALQAGPLACGSLPEVEQAPELEAEGYLTHENGFTIAPDGSIAVAVRTVMPEVNPVMWQWWFGWHGCADARYKLWHPGAHVSAHWEDGQDHHAYVGRNSIISEYIGKNLLEASIQFKSPTEFGFSPQVLNHPEKAVYICARLGHPSLPVDYGYLVHQIRTLDGGGAEMRSRFWVGGKYVAVRKKGRLAEAVTAVLKTFKSLPDGFGPDLLRHCAEEMNHLAAFLPKLYAETYDVTKLEVNGQVHHKQDAEFDKTMHGFLYNQQRFGRVPDLIAEPATVEDIIQIVRYARKVGKRLTVLSGGRSFSANAMRKDCIVISMKKFQSYSLNLEAMTATAEPGLGGSDLMKALYKKEVFFPAGHCTGVCLGGYLLQGGYGWNGRKLGIACKSVLGLDIVTADGELLHANAEQNSDLYWAARGAGAGFFGVVVKFYLQLYPLPKYQAIIAHDFAIKHVEDVYRWAHEVGPTIPKSVEFQMMMSQNMLNMLGPGIEAFAPIFADTRDEFEEAKLFMENSPIKKKAILRTPAFNPGIDIFYKATMTHYPANYHYGVDNMWTHAGIDELLPYIKAIAKSLPPAPSHFLWLNWQPEPLDTDMAYSKEDQIYLALYSCWKRREDTPKYTNWASEQVRSMQHLSSGIQLADEGLHKRTDKFLSDEHFQRLQAIRQQRDPMGLFLEWHSKPEMG